MPKYAAETRQDYLQLETRWTRSTSYFSAMAYEAKLKGPQGSLQRM